MVDPAWWDTVLHWLDHQPGITRVGPPEPPRVRAWSTTCRIPTATGAVWFKANGPAAHFEARLYDILAAAVPDLVLTPIATDPARGWLVLPDGGPRLTDPATLVDILPRYAQAQLDLAPHVPDLLAAGLPDMRPAAMPDRFREALAEIEAPEIEAMADSVAEWSTRLAASPIPVSIDHNDLHVGNLLPGGRCYDWGDSVVAHPFASLLVPLRQHGEQVIAAYLEPFTHLARLPELRADLELACRLGKIARALVFHRAIAAAPGVLADAPRDLLVALPRPSFYD
ncbi:phosphotransferase [Actinokineospora enzanensis]|uniref:phosphotransferase n=1 Tax=Actinokineospora enzanensis TaxID=155975 RepID=UPI00037E6BDD|nr:phosphotransferase [Actinokineospora enzanensis]